MKLRTHEHEFLESFSEFWIEYCVNDRIDKTIHITQPCGEQKCSDARLTGQTKFTAHRIHNIAGEERHPAYEEDTWCIPTEKYVSVKLLLVLNMHCLISTYMHTYILVY